eukprot:354777-Chlamydomonas_euryale.AAC.8
MFKHDQEAVHLLIVCVYVAEEESSLRPRKCDRVRPTKPEGQEAGTTGQKEGGGEGEKNNRTTGRLIRKSEDAEGDKEGDGARRRCKLAGAGRALSAAGWGQGHMAGCGEGYGAIRRGGMLVGAAVGFAGRSSELLPALPTGAALRESRSAPTPGRLAEDSALTVPLPPRLRPPSLAACSRTLPPCLPLQRTRPEAEAAPCQHLASTRTACEAFEAQARRVKVRPLLPWALPSLVQHVLFSRGGWGPGRRRNGHAPPHEWWQTKAARTEIASAVPHRLHAGAPLAPANTDAGV